MFRCNRQLCVICFSVGFALAVSALIPSEWVRLALAMVCAGVGFLCRRP